MSEKKLDNTITGVRSNHNLGGHWLGSADFGRLVPFFWKELVGTDEVKTLRPRISMQMLNFASPTFGRIDLYVHYFAVPLRLLMADFNDMYSQTGVGKNSPCPYWTAKDFQTAYLQMAEPNRRAMFKHWTSMGLPPFFHLPSSVTNLDDEEPISLFPFRAYNQIYWDFYRDPEVYRDDNRDTVLDTTSGHIGTGMVNNRFFPRVRNFKDCWISELFADSGVSPSGSSSGLSNNPNNNKVYATASASTQLRTIEALTRLSERLSLSGKRQIDQLFAQAGIKPDFTKLQMCQYIGGAKQEVLVDDIISTADTLTEGTDSYSGAALGQKSASGYLALNSLKVNYKAEEPCIIMGILSVMPKFHFVQGLGREWRRKTRDDFFRRELEHVGQVAVRKEEVATRYATYNKIVDYTYQKDKETFAFSQPYYEYKRGTDVLAGDLMYYHNCNLDGSLDDTITYMESLGMYCDFPQDRLFNADNMQVPAAQCNEIFYYLGGSLWADGDDHFHIDIQNDCIINRPMDGYAIPTLETTENPHAGKQALSQGVEL